MNKSRGIVHMALLIVVVFVLIVIVAFFAVKPKVSNFLEDVNDNGCYNSNREKVVLSHAPVDLDSIQYIIPLGKMYGEHVNPTDHQYYVASYYFEKEKQNKVNVYAPGDGTISSIEYHSYDTGPQIEEDYRVVIDHDCGVSSIFIHIDELVSKIAEKAPKNPAVHEDIHPASTEIPVKEGELLGTYYGTLDYNVFDPCVELTTFALQDKPVGSENITHVKDPFDYFSEPIRSELQSMSLGYKEPIGGKIDYDIEGKLVGNWLKKDENRSTDQTPSVKDLLTIAYNNIDTHSIVVSTGDYFGEARQFGVKGNAPDPAGVGVGSGIIKYELVNYDYYNGNRKWNPETLVRGLKLVNEDIVQATMLVKMIGERKLKMQIFNGKSASEVGGFTASGVRIYER